MPSAVQSPRALISINLETNEHTIVSAWRGAIWAAHGSGSALGRHCQPSRCSAAAPGGCSELLPGIGRGRHLAPSQGGEVRGR